MQRDQVGPLGMSGVGLLNIGRVAPFFGAKTDVNDNFAFSQMGGRWIVLLFFGGLTDPVGGAADGAARRSGVFDDLRASYFGVTNDPDDRRVRG